MSNRKKKARKKRNPVVSAPLPDENKDKSQYRDEFQTSVGRKIEDLGGRLEGQGKKILYGVAALVVLLLIAGLFYVWNRRSNNSAQAALGDAIETSQAQVTDSPLPAGVSVKVFKTKKLRAEAAIKEFQAVADKYGGSYAEKARYFIAVNRLDVNRDAGIKELQDLSSKSDPVGALSKFALAQEYGADGKYSEAEKLYKELIKLQDPVVSVETVRFELAKSLESQNKAKEAVALYYQIAKEAAEAKDPEGNSVPMSQSAREAKEKVKELDPEKAKEIPEEQLPAGLPLGM